MRIRKYSYIIFVSLFAISLASYAFYVPQDNKQKNISQKSKDTNKEKKNVIAQPILDSEDSIPDSLLHTRWTVQPTMPTVWDDLDQNAMDLKRPDNMNQTVCYNDSLNVYTIGSKINGVWVNTPIVMTPEEYRKWSEKKLMRDFFRSKNTEEIKSKGKEKFDFSNMHFDLGPAEKIFGPGGVSIKTQGTAELKLGATLKNIDNPSLPLRNRKTTTMDFDEKINLNVNGKVGDKVNMNLNYNTDATFDYDAQNLKLKYDGKEDEIIKLVEAGNVSFPSNSSLISGASSLFGIRTDLQFGKLRLQLVASQKKSSNKSVSSSGGVQLTDFNIDVANYEENRHFFLSKYFHDNYDNNMRLLPNVSSGVIINRVEIWVTNNTGTTSNTRNIIALTDLGENSKVSNKLWATTGMPVPCNAANTEYSTIVNSYSGARDIDEATSTLDGIPGFEGGADYEKLESARLLNSSEYTVSTSLGYVSLKSGIQPDQVLAVAYEYTYGGVTYQVGEFASDITDINKSLYVKSLKNTSNNPMQGNWDLMMKNVYYLASNVEKTKFRLDVKYQSDTTGVYLTYIPETEVKGQTILKDLGADRLDQNNKAHSDGYFDYVDGYTVSNGRVFLPKAEPFGAYLYNYLVSKGVSAEKASKYAFTELYDSTKTVAKQVAEKDKYILQGHFKGTLANVISLGDTNIPQGSVVVTAGGVTLTEGSDYSVDYTAGEVTILNQSIIDAGTAVNVSLESNSNYGQQRKTFFGANWEYDFSKEFQLSGTIQHLSEQTLTTKVSMGSEPVSNTLWGLNINWKKESQWLTNMLDKLPFLHVTQPSQISFTGEFAQLLAGQGGGIQGNASYLDDFESTSSSIDVSTPTSWMLCSVPSMFSEHSDKSTLASGYNRSLLAWYTIDPLFTNRSSSLTPGYIKSDLDQLSNFYVRAIYSKELFPNRYQSSYSSSTSTLSILNLAYYPNERGPYNFSTDLATDGTLNNPTQHWGGMMRKLDTSDFEAANIQYIEFWMLDPFIYTRKDGVASEYGGDFYINLGEVSEDVLHDGKKFYESGMPVDGSSSYITTQWGKIPTTTTVTYAFATTSGSRALQDVGLNGLNDEEERNFSSYQNFLTSIQGKVNPAVFDSIHADPANDDYHYFRGTDYDNMKASILRRYKYINNPQGNSPDTDTRSESYDTSYKTTPDVEDINQDYTLNEYEKYYQYKVSIRPEDLVVGNNFIVDKRVTKPTLRNGSSDTEATWYEFRIPLDQYTSKVGSISDFSSIRFMRMFMTNFKHPVILRFANMDLVRGEWRNYDGNIDNTSGSGTLAMSTVGIEENSDKIPVNYTLPPGISRVTDPTQPQLIEDNEQALAVTVSTLSPNEGKAVYKTTSTDLREYKRLQMYIHANALEQNTTDLQDKQIAAFIRLGSDYKNNYYEYEIPLKLTPAGIYSNGSNAGRAAVWPDENVLNIPLSLFTSLKKARNKARGNGSASYARAYSAYDEDNPGNKITVMGNPTLGEVKVLVLGVRNLSNQDKSGEVWFNELRLHGNNKEGGWATQGNLNVQMSDLGTLNVQGKYISDGFGGIEDAVNSRTTDDYSSYTVTTNLELGKFFPDKAKVSAPLYYSISKEQTMPRYNPLDTDVKLDDALNSAANKQERDSIKSIAITKTTNTNLSLSNVRVGIKTKGHPMPYDPANFSFSYAHSHKYTSGETTVYEKEDQWNGSMNYTWSPVYKTIEPFKKIKNKSKWLDLLKRFGLNWLPQNVAFNSDMTRNYYELQERDLESSENKLPLTFSEQFLWNRQFTLRWDFTKDIHMNFQSATNAEIEEPYTPINKNLYPDHYNAWKDSVWNSIKHFGTPLDYNQSFSLSYQLPINLIPIFDWINSDANYQSTYSWMRGTTTEDDVNYGNTIAMNRTFNVNGSFNMLKLYNHIPFLKKANERFERKSNDGIKKSSVKDGKPKNTRKTKDNPQMVLPKNKNSFEREITLMPDTTIVVAHEKRTKHIIVSGKTADGRTIKIRYRKLDKDRVRILNKVDSAFNIKLIVTPKESPENKGWYKTAQCLARVLMMVRNVNVSYRNQYAMSLPGFLNTVGDAFGQKRTTDALSPGLDFAFGLAGDSYVESARDKGWLLVNDSIATPATTNSTEDLQINMTLEPIKNLKIDLTASRTQTKASSIQYMYTGCPTTKSGTFTMTTISLRSALEGIGSADNGYYSKSFSKFCNALSGYRDRVESQYIGATYPSGTSLAGTKFNKANGTVNEYSSDVMIPAFLNTYTLSGGNSLNIFPTLAKLLPNWSVRYSGLSQLPWFRDNFKSINLSHSYRSVYAIGSYSSYSTFSEYMNGLGFISDATTGNPVPSSMFNISTVSINEAFSPLLGVDVTFNNNITAKLEYRTTRVLSLSMTSVQINEALSRDWVFGMGYRINDMNLFGRTYHKVKGGKGRNKEEKNSNNKSGINNSMNLRLDLSYRNQASITRDIATMVSAASSGNTAFKLAFTADYTLSRMLTMSFYYDYQNNTPLLSSSSYPTSTRDFGLSLKFSLSH